MAFFLPLYKANAETALRKDDISIGARDELINLQKINLNKSLFIKNGQFFFKKKKQNKELLRLSVAFITCGECHYIVHQGNIEAVKWHVNYKLINKRNLPEKEEKKKGRKKELS